ncbi:MAG TPA: CHAP domain-containing protein, partial [Acidimicrobiales bacterium]|nr:CHAP domain-containing protein [Acidimicrobiales bacterium]
ALAPAGARPRQGALVYGVVGLVLIGAIAIIALLVTRAPGGTVVRTADGEVVRVPKLASLPPLRARIVSIAESQIGYKTDPATTYCNKYSAYWASGAADCGNANLDEEWCADFAAWVWKQAGVPVTYQYINGDLNSSAASFYEWGVDKGTWHPLGSGYVPQPGDVAVYGLDPATLVAAHVAIVIGYQPGDRGPTAVNGDGDTNAFSVVEVRTDEYVADVHPDGAPLSGYVAPS